MVGVKRGGNGGARRKKGEESYRDMTATERNTGRIVLRVF
jgi:hypothetical protein